jgi:hypothetical protein
MQRNRSFVSSGVSQWIGPVTLNRNAGPGRSQATALAYPSSLVAAGITASGDYWLTGNGSTPYKIYCFYENGIMWARTTSIEKGYALGRRSWYTYTLGDDYSSANKATFSIAPSNFGNATGTNLSTMVRVVGGTFSGAIAETPGRRFSAIWRGINLQNALDSASVTTIGTSSPGYSQNGISFTAYSGASLVHSNDGWNLTIANNAQTGVGGWDALNFAESGWILHGGAPGGDDSAALIYGRTDQNISLMNVDFSRFEMYVTI